MKLKIKNLNWSAGRPVIFLHDKTAKKMNVFVNERVVLSNSHSVYAIVDIFPRMVDKNEIGISKEVSTLLKLKTGSIVDVMLAEMAGAAPIIKKKMAGEELSSEEFIKLIDAIVNNKITEAEIAYFAASEKFSGLSMKETIYLVQAMVKTGAKLNFPGKCIADKHCIGGIAGNRTTPIVVSICAAAGLKIPKTSSRAITSASGTADVVETISNVDLPLKKIKKIVSKTGACLAWGGSLGLAPSDDKIIHVERILNLDIQPQMIASIMSKKISAGSNYLLIDIPYGVGAKINSLREAKKLGEKFEKVAKHFKIKIKSVYTNGDQPIGNGVGPILEMQDVLGVLKNEGPEDLKEKSILLSAELMKLCGIKNSRKQAEIILNSGKALEKFIEIINAQNGKKDFKNKIEKLQLAKFKRIIKTKKRGKITEINNKKINSLCRILGTPETIGAGAYLHKHLGKTKKGEVLITLYSESKTKMREALKFWKKQKPIIIN